MVIVLVLIFIVLLLNTYLIKRALIDKAWNTSVEKLELIRRKLNELTTDENNKGGFVKRKIKLSK